MVPADSRRIPRAPRYSGYRYASSRFVYGPLTLCGPTFQKVPLTRSLATARSYNPGHAVTCQVWALPRSLATTGGIIVYFLFLRVLRCFSSPRWPPASAGCHPFRMTGCPIRKSADQRSFAPTRGLSQLITSFIASESQGIRHVPFLAFFRRAEPRFPFSGEPRTAYTFSFNFYFFSVTTCQRTFPVPGTGEWRITDSNR